MVDISILNGIINQLMTEGAPPRMITYSDSIQASNGMAGENESHHRAS